MSAHYVDREIIADTIKDMVNQGDEESIKIIAEVLMKCGHITYATMREISNVQPNGIRKILSLLLEEF